MKYNYTGKSLLEIREEYGLGSSGFWDNTWWHTESFATEKPPVGMY